MAKILILVEKLRSGAQRYEMQTMLQPVQCWT
jgi:hypothetical protein